MRRYRFSPLLVLSSLTWPATADRFAILVGIGDYHNLPDFRYPHADVAGIGRTLIDYGEFPEQQIFMLKGSDATYPNIRSAMFDWLGKQQRVAPTDLVLFYFSGYSSIGVKDGTQSVRRFLLPWRANDLFE